MLSMRLVFGSGATCLNRGYVGCVSRLTPAGSCTSIESFPWAGTVLLHFAILALSTSASAQLRPSQPEPPSGWTPKSLATAKKYMVAAAHPLAVDAGVAMLERGGSAVDAMIATQLVLNQVEPSSSGIGGGAYFVYYDAKAKKVIAIDGRETAP